MPAYFIYHTCLFHLSKLFYLIIYNIYMKIFHHQHFITIFHQSYTRSKFNNKNSSNSIIKTMSSSINNQTSTTIVSDQKSIPIVIKNEAHPIGIKTDEIKDEVRYRAVYRKCDFHLCASDNPRRITHQCPVRHKLYWEMRRDWTTKREKKLPPDASRVFYHNVTVYRHGAKQKPTTEAWIFCDPVEVYAQQYGDQTLTRDSMLGDLAEDLKEHFKVRKDDEKSKLPDIETAVRNYWQGEKHKIRDA